MRRSWASLRSKFEQWRQEGLLDPGDSGSLGELDLLRWLTIHSYEARGYSSDQLAAAIKSGDTHPFLGEFLFPSGPRLSLDNAAERAGVDAHSLSELRTALGLSQEGIAESWLGQLEAFKTMQAAGLPWEAVLEGARVYGDTLWRLAETEVRLVHVHILLTEAVASSLSEGVRTEPVGVRMLRGAGRPLRLFRLITRGERRDPVCNVVVADPPAAQLQQNGEALWFCSTRCLREFLAADAADA